MITKAKEVLQHYTIDATRRAQISLWGICPVHKQPFIGTIKWNVLSESYLIDIQFGDVEKLTWQTLGQSNAVERLEELINVRLQQLSNKASSDYWRIPYYPLRTIIDSKFFDGVGGNIQLAMVNAARFDHMWVLTPPKAGDTLWSAKYRNIDVFEIIGNRVGDCSFALSGMDMDFPHDGEAIMR
jgi:hypothetical protein